MASSWLTNRLYEHPDERAAAPITSAVTMRERMCRIIGSPFTNQTRAPLGYSRPNQAGWSPRSTTAAAAAAAAAETAKPAAETAAKPAPAETSAAERPGTAVPAAPRPAAPVAVMTARPATHGRRDGSQHEEHHEQPDKQHRTRPRLRPAARRGPDTLQRDVAAFGNPRDHARHARKQPRAVLSLPEFREHVLAARLACKAVSDELLEVVADFDLDPAILDPHHDQQT